MAITTYITMDNLYGGIIRRVITSPQLFLIIGIAIIYYIDRVDILCGNYFTGDYGYGKIGLCFPITQTGFHYSELKFRKAPR